MESNQEPTFQIYQKPDEEIEIDPEKYYGMSIDKLKNIPLRKLLPEGFIKNLDPNFKFFCKLIKENLRQENYEILGTTGFPGTGKSQCESIIGCIIDPRFSFGKNINFIPVASEIEKDYLDLPMYSFFQIDEASRSVHKHKWYEKTQQKLSTLYDTERENHYICTGLIMPRFNNFTENFRNFFIKYWINIITRGVCIVYRRDEDKDTKDPWNIDASVKLKNKYWGSKRVFERTVSDIIRMEQKTKNYWFYFTIPEIPKEVWSIYKLLKLQSRVKMREDANNLQVESNQDRINRLKNERWVSIVRLINEGKTTSEVGVLLNKSEMTIKRDIKEIKTYNQIKGTSPELEFKTKSDIDIDNNIYNLNSKDKNNKIPEAFDKI